MTSRHTTALIASLIASSAGAQNTLTINTHHVIPGGNVFVLAANDTLNITTTGILDAPPATSGTAIILNGSTHNAGSIRAALGSEINGLTLNGMLFNNGFIEADTLEITGQLDNFASAVVESGSYRYPGIGLATPVSGGRPITGVGLTIASTGLVENHGSWHSRGDVSIMGQFRNTGSFVSANNTQTLPAGSLPYSQLLRIGHPFAGAPAGEFLNQPGGTMRLDTHTLLVNEGDLSNGGQLLISGGTIQTGRWGAIHNRAGGLLTIDGGALNMESGASRDFDNAGTFHIYRGTFDNLGSAALVNTPGGVVHIGELGVMLQAPQAQLRNEGGRILIDGRLEGALGNSSGRVELRTGALMVGTIGQQEGGELLLDGELVGELHVLGGVLEGAGLVRGDVLLGGFPFPVTQSCHADGYACFQPGQGIATFTIDGDLTFHEGAVLQLEVGRNAQGLLFSDLVLTDSTRFEAGSIIEVVLDPGVGVIAQDIDLLRCSGGCNFAGNPQVRVIGGEGLLAWRNNALVLTPVPEPAGWALLAGGLAALGLWRRRVESGAERT